MKTILKILLCAIAGLAICYLMNENSEGVYVIFEKIVAMLAIGLCILGYALISNEDKKDYKDEYLPKI